MATGSIPKASEATEGFFKPLLKFWALAKNRVIRATVDNIKLTISATEAIQSGSLNGEQKKAIHQNGKLLRSPPHVEIRINPMQS